MVVAVLGIGAANSCLKSGKKRQVVYRQAITIWFFSNSLKYHLGPVQVNHVNSQFGYFRLSDQRQGRQHFTKEDQIQPTKVER